MLPPRLEIGDEIRVIAPSTSMTVLKSKQIKIATERLEQLGFRVTFSENVNLYDDFYTVPLEQAYDDLHEAFTDNNVKAIIAATEGFHANRMLQSLDYNLIKNNKKILIGHGDITALTVAIHKKCDLITYYGPNFATLGTKYRFDYTVQSFFNSLTNDSLDLYPAEKWSDGPWHADEGERLFHKQTDYVIINEGKATGKLIGGNLTSLNLLKGTEFMPSLKDAILFIEDDETSHPFMFERDLQSLLHLKDAKELRGLLIGRFQEASMMTEAALRKIVMSKKELRNIPILANVNFGHVDPVATIPIGASASITAKKGENEIFI